ncbi:hypothetical protein DNTS_029705 [Danionella cerebrum]|uniref:C-C motif chemokine n=1 Tax=Danionella cerebrum TaxID=2873325 RepID=A0A553QUJ7_9TELE|nr:hypothetical protein DNTS_029705 [Danionella translucida]
MSASRLAVFSGVLLLLLCTVSFSQGLRVGPSRCCFTFTKVPIPFKRVTGYSFTSQQCPKQAVVFETVKRRSVCANPTDSWVKEYRQTIDAGLLGGQGGL